MTGWRYLVLTVLVAAVLAAGASGFQGGPEFKSGPAVGKPLPGAFQPFNLSGKWAKDRPHCLVCEFGLNPVVLTFVREGPEGNPQEVLAFLQQIDKTVDKFFKEHFLHSFVVFVTPDAKSSGTEAKIDDPDVLIKEAQNRAKLTERLAVLAESLKNVPVTYLPDGPKGYDISAKPGVTVVLYAKHRVEAVYAYPDGKFTAAATAEVLKGIDVMVGRAKAKPKQ